jgi:HAD superfamily hydrolase (TIGR01484 family)
MTPQHQPWLVALDIDGTTLRDDGFVSDAVIEQVRRLDRAGHNVTFATGRSSAAAIPVLDRLGIAPQFLVCSNGAVTLRRHARCGARSSATTSPPPR